MTGSLLRDLLAILCLWTTLAASLSVSANPVSRSAQIDFAQIIVNGRPLTGPNSAAHRRDGRILVPITSIARALGDAVSIDASKRIVTVQRQTGLTSVFDAQLGSVSENGSNILSISNSGEIVFSPNTDELLLPVEITAALFDVSIRYDDVKNAVIVTRGLAQTDQSPDKNARGFAEIYQADYEYNLNGYSTGLSQNLILTAAGRIADGRFFFTSNSSGLSARRMSMRNATFTFERPNGQRFVAGDFGTGTSLQLFSANIRGGSVFVPIGRFGLTAFAGKAYSGIVFPSLDPLLQPPPPPIVYDPYRYDTNVFGFFASTASVNNRRAGPFNFSAGAMRFSGPDRDGDLASGSMTYDTSRLKAQIDLGFGKFAGNRSDSVRVDGLGAAVDAAGTFQLTRKISLQARYAHIGENFLSPQSGIREPLDLKAAGVAWSPRKWLSTSLNASVSKRPDGTQTNKFVTAAFAITPTNGLPRFYFSHTQSSTSFVHSAAFTTLNASKEFSRLRLFLNATRIKSLGAAAINAQLGANYALNDMNSFEFYQGVGSHRSLNGQLDWRSSNRLDGRLSFTAGMGYSHGAAPGLSIYERMSASVKLPRQTSVQVNYFHTNAGPTLLISLKGALFRKHEARAFLDSPASRMNSFGKVTGRVYQDVDQNGRFDPGVDIAQAGVKVRVDGNRFVVSDANGLYNLDAVAAGDHTVYLDLLSVRADLTLLGGATQEMKLLPGHSSVFDFRLVRTGRISGRVWFDKNENGMLDEDETPLADVRVVTASGRDTLTDSDGNFTIGDLPPGEHVILLDEKTLPEKTVSGTKPMAILVTAGHETRDIYLAVIPIPAEIKRFGTKPNQ